MQSWLSETKTLFSSESIRFHIQYCLCEDKCKNYPKQNHFRWKRPRALIKFVFCRMILQNRLYTWLILSWISKISRFYPAHLLDSSITGSSCVADFRRKLASEVDANQSHKSLWTPLYDGTKFTNRTTGAYYLYPSIFIISALYAFSIPQKYCFKHSPVILRICCDKSPPPPLPRHIKKKKKSQNEWIIWAAYFFFWRKPFYVNCVLNTRST